VTRLAGDWVARAVVVEAQRNDWDAVGLGCFAVSEEVSEGSGITSLVCSPTSHLD
jgi:hypothetical protein